MPRASGKTTLLIKESARNKKPIVVGNDCAVQRIIDQANEMSEHIPEPISLSRYMNNWNYRHSVDRGMDKYNGVLIDELDYVLKQIFRKPIDKVTYTSKEMEELNNMDYRTVTAVSNSSVSQTNGLTTNVGTTTTGVDTSINAKDVINIGNGFQITNEGLHYKYDSAWSNTHNFQIPELITKDMKENILDINVIVPGKVVEITFYDMLTEKMVCHKDDTFDLRKCCFIAIAKHLYKKEYTQEGIEHMATQLMYQKKYVKIVDKALKAYKKKEDEKAKKARMEEEERIIRERQSLKRWRQKQRRKERYRKEVVNLISDSINEAKRKRKVQETVY